MAIEVLMPALSPTMTEGTVATWIKAEGEQVLSGDVLCEIETDKANMELEAVDEGIMGKILVAAGTEGVAINTPIAVIFEKDEDALLSDDKANIIDKGNEENELLEQLKKENSELKEKLFSLKKEHKSDLKNLNDVLEMLNSILGEENVGS